MKRVLMVAYHFPPLAGSSGIQRTLRFAQQLPDFGWEPIWSPILITDTEGHYLSLDSNAALLRSQNNCLISVTLILLLCTILRKFVL
jgi:hypothetical protein